MHAITDWDDEYANAEHIPDAMSFPPRWAADAEAFRRSRLALGKAELDVAYGAAPREVYDLFWPDVEPLGLAVYVHGGYWKAFGKSSWSHLAQPSSAAKVLC